MPNPPPGFEWDEHKAAWNHRVHGVSFAAIHNFDFETAIETEDLRDDYGEERMFALGKIGRTLHALVYTRRKGKGASSASAKRPHKKGKSITRRGVRESAAAEF